MRKWLFALLLALIPSIASAQYTTVTANVVDVNNTPYANGSFTVQFVDPGTSGQLPLLNGNTFQKVYGASPIDSFGNFTIPLPDNNVIASSSGATGTQWTFGICSQPYAQFNGIKYCFNWTQTVTGASVNISAALKAAAATLPVPGGSAIIKVNNSVVANPNLLNSDGAVFDVTGSNIQVDTSITGKMNNIRTVDGVLFGAGVDLGAGINAADTDLGANPGEIQVFAAPGLGTLNITTSVSIKNGHVLRFIQGFATTATAGITVEQGGSILGVEGGIETCSSTPSGTVIFHEFSGDMITYNGGSSGGGGSRGGGSIHDLTLCNDGNTPGDLNGNAIKITGTAVNTNQSSFVDVGRVFTDGTSATKRWTRGLLADGTPIGGTNGIRNIWVHDSRFTSSGTNNQDVEFLNCFNCEMTNVVMSNSSNGAQTIGATVSGSSGAISSNTKLMNLDTGTLVLDWANNTTLFGGAFSGITVTSNAGGQSLLIPGLLVNAPSNSSLSTTQIVWYDLANSALRTDGNVLLANGKSLQGLTAGAVAKNLIGVSAGGSETLDLNGLGINTGTGNVGITNPNGNLLGIVAVLTTTAAASDNVAVTGMTSSGHCSLTPTNALAAADAASTYISAKTANQITVTHPVSAGRTWDVACWPN